MIPKDLQTKTKENQRKQQSTQNGVVAYKEH